MRLEGVEDFYPLSPIQEGLLFHSLSSREHGLYLIQIPCVIRGELDIEAFELAWQAVVDRHTILRSYFVWEGLDQAIQVVQRAVNLRIERRDWRQLDTSSQEQRLKEYLSADRRRGFNLSEAPLMRLTLIEAGDGARHFIWTHHHLLIDGWCLHLIMKEVLTLYKTYLNGDDVRLEPARSYRDYIAWLQRQDKIKAEAFWREMLKDFSTPTTLALARKQEADADREQSYSWHQVYLSEAQTNKLRAVARQNRLTVNTLVQGAWALLLSRYSGEDDIVFGAVAAGRPPELEGVESIIGPFINTLPVRTQVKPGEPLLNWLKALQDQQVEARQYEYSALTDVQKCSQIPPGRSLFENVISFQNYPSFTNWQDNRKGFEISIGKFLERSNYPLSLRASLNASLSLEILYDSTRFEQVVIKRLLDHIVALLEDFASGLDKRVTTLPLISDADRRRLEEWSRGEREAQDNSCVHQLIDLRTARSPLSQAVVCPSNSLSYAQLQDSSNCLAHLLMASNISPESVVAVCLDRSAQLIVSILASLKAGAAFLPLDPHLPQRRLSFMLEDSAAAAVLTDSRLARQIDFGPRPVLLLDSIEEELGRQSAADPVTAVGPDNLAYIIYTSGSTGEPKGVMIPHRGLTNLVSAQIKAFHIKPASRVLQFASISFDASVSEIFTALVAGATLVLADKQRMMPGGELEKLLRQERISTVTLPPSALRVMSEQQLDELEVVISAGESCTAEVVGKWSRGRKMINAYGPTEVTVCATMGECEASDEEVTIGRAIQNAEVYVLDRELELAAVGVKGEIYVGGAGVGRGYVGRADATAEKYVPDPYGGEAGRRMYRTGDYGRYREDGRVEYLGRRDGQVKIRGYRIEVGEIEGMLRRDERVKEAVVEVREDEAGNKRLVAYVVGDEESKAKEKGEWGREIKRRIREEMPEYMEVWKVIRVEEMPKTVSGKIDRQEMRKLWEAAAREEEEEREVEGARNEVEEAMIRIWEEVLGVKGIGIHDNFFELGGDSILGIQVVSRANNLGLQLYTDQLFKHETIAELAAVVGIANVVQAEQGDVTGYIPLTPIQRWFFEQANPEPHYYNQAMMLEIDQKVDGQTMASVIKALIKHHDILRVRFERVRTDWQQFNAPPDDTAPLIEADLSVLADRAQERAVQTAAAALQSSLDLENGPLMRAGLFKLGEEKPTLLMIVIHHLAVDGVSWRILLEDLQVAFEQASQLQEINLPAKTTSFKEWAERLQENAYSNRIDQELDYWLNQDWSGAEPIPADFAREPGTTPSERVVTVKLSQEETSSLLLTVPKAFGARIDEILLAALAEAFARWSEREKIIIFLEGHGRESLFESVDLSKTVGWFTTLYPILLDLKRADNSIDALDLVKRQLQSLPNNGIAYGILRHLRDDTSKQLKQMITGEVVFNYLGQFDQFTRKENTFRAGRWSVGPSHSPKMRRSYLLEINGMVIGGQLQTTWTYSENAHKRSSVENLATLYSQALKRLIEASQVNARGAFIASYPVEVEFGEEWG